MRIIDFNTIINLGIEPELCLNWVEEAFKLKYTSNLPAKISTKFGENIFFNTMPCYIPSIKRFGVKEVYRFPLNQPSLKSEILLYDTEIGKLLAVMDASWITAMRTGAVAASAIKLLRSSNAKEYAFLGLGNTARATLLCLLSSSKNETLNIRLLAYKGQEVLFIDRFKQYNNVKFTIKHSIDDLIYDADVIVSCITATDSIIAKVELFKKGVLLVPVHTRGFQNCDLFFDKIIVDDIEHVKEFRYFKEFKSICEFSQVLLCEIVGRNNDEERILAYNIGIALHDVYFANMIYNQIDKGNENILNDCKIKFWI